MMDALYAVLTNLGIAVLLLAGLVGLLFVLSLGLDSHLHTKGASKRAAAVLDDPTLTFPTWPGDQDDGSAFEREDVKTSHRDNVVAFPVRGDRGEADGGFLQRVVKVCVVVTILAGGAVYVTSHAEAWLSDDAPTPAGPLRSELGQVEVVDELPDVDGYDRDARFGSDWTTRDGCDTRDEILARDLTGVTREGDGCAVLTGTLRDPYTGERIGFDATADPNAVQIDHVYPLAAAWDAGAADWTDDERVAFANDPRNLLAVDGRANASKGDSTPGEWMPHHVRHAATRPDRSAPEIGRAHV